LYDSRLIFIFVQSFSYFYFNTVFFFPGVGFFAFLKSEFLEQRIDKSLD